MMHFDTSAVVDAGLAGARTRTEVCARVVEAAFICACSCAFAFGCACAFACACACACGCSCRTQGCPTGAWQHGELGRSVGMRAVTRDLAMFTFTTSASISTGRASSAAPVEGTRVKGLAGSSRSVSPIPIAGRCSCTPGTVRVNTPSSEGLIATKYMSYLRHSSTHN